MRWFVEVASISQKEAPEQWVVEATQWQPALQAARSLRGEAAEMTGFSIELLEDGFRAIDPATFVRYVVRRAPDGTPISRPLSRPPPAHATNGGAAGSVSPKASPQASSAPRPQSSPSQPPPGSKAERIAALLDIGAGGGPPRPSGVPRPASQPPRPASQHPPAPTGLQALAGRPPSASQPALAPNPASVSTAPTSEPLPPAELLFKREEDPSASSPLTYRETAWSVPEGTSIDAAVRLLTGMFEGVRASLAGVQAGKLVNMAVFDHRFQGKPQRPPLASLAWKDWKDQGQGPQIRRLGEPSSILPPPPSVPTGSFPSAPAAVAAPAPLVAPVAAAPAPAPLAAVPAPAPLVPSVPPPAPAPLVASVPPPAPAPLVPSVPPPAPLPVFAEAPPPVAAAHEALPPAAAPAPAARQSVPSMPANRGSIPSVPGSRLSGDELITTLFEAMHDLNFLRDPLEGADFVLALVMDKLPCTVALVHFYDINTREFVVVRAVGPGALKTVQARTPEKDPLIAEAMHKRRSVVIADASGDERAQKGRWGMVDISCRSLVCAPVEQGGRFLGLLELANPRDGGPFKEGDGHALTYIGEQFAEFLAARGIVLHPDRLTPPTGIVALKK